MHGCLGSIVTKNTFFTLDGSVPEDIKEKMDQLAAQLSVYDEVYLGKI